jgi:hypothetical protein
MNRRSLLAGLAALSAVPVAAAIAKPNPDAELIWLCETYPSAWLAADRCPVELEPGVPEWDHYCSVLGAILESEPKTLAGIVAKAHVALKEENDGCDGPALMVVNDLLRVMGGAA